ncbi:hypothetical protein YC2023_005348 [Brassica napus]
MPFPPHELCDKKIKTIRSQMASEIFDETRINGTEKRDYKHLDIRHETTSKAIRQLISFTHHIRHKTTSKAIRQLISFTHHIRHKTTSKAIKQHPKQQYN